MLCIFDHVKLAEQYSSRSRDFRTEKLKIINPAIIFKILYLQIGR